MLMYIYIYKLTRGWLGRVNNLRNNSTEGGSVS